MTVITMLASDLRAIEKLFERFEKAGPRDDETKREIVGRIVDELSAHAAIEEQIFYPTIRHEVDGVEDHTLEVLEERHVVKWLLSELESMAPYDERYTAKTTVLIESVRHHVKKEEHDLFPKVRWALPIKQLSDLGAALAHAKEIAPQRPHPRSPDTPRGNFSAGSAAASVEKVAERVKDVVSGTVDRVEGNDVKAKPPETASQEGPRRSQEGGTRSHGQESHYSVSSCSLPPRRLTSELRPNREETGDCTHFRRTRYQ